MRPNLSNPPFGSIGLLQMRCGTDPVENLDKVTARIREAAAQGARIICTQELFRSPYFCQNETIEAFDLAEPIPGPTTSALQPLAAELGVVIIALSRSGGCGVVAISD